MRAFLLKLSVATVAVLGICGLLPLATAAAACDATTTAGAIQCGTDNAAGVPSGASSPDDLNSTVANIINLLSIAVGVVAVIMIIVGGFRYITSGGKQESITSAKNTLLYAIIGLIIVALAQVIVQFVLNKSLDVNNNTTGSSNSAQTPGSVSQGAANNPH